MGGWSYAYTSHATEASALHQAVLVGSYSPVSPAGPFQPALSHFSHTFSRFCRLYLDSNKY